MDASTLRLLGGAGLVFIIVSLLVLRAVFSGSRKIRIPGPTLVLRKFEIDDRPNAQTFIEVIGRPAGILNWILTTMHVNTETRMVVNQTDVSLRNSSLFGVKQWFAPLRHVAETRCGFYRPIGYLVLGVVIVGLTALCFHFVLLAVPSRLDTSQAISNGTPYWICGLLLGGGFGVAYLFLKRIQVFVSTTGSVGFGVKFKPSFVENTSIEFPQALRLIAALNKAVLLSAGLPSPSGVVTTSPVQPVASRQVSVCPSCSSPTEPGSGFCENCGARLA